MPKEKPRPGQTLIARNRRASFDHDLGDRFEAGIVLKGSEVKMLRAGKAQITDAFCTVSRGEAFLQGMRIAEMAGAAFGHGAPICTQAVRSAICCALSLPDGGILIALV